MGKAPSATRGPWRLYKAVMTRVTGSPPGQKEGSEGGQAGSRAAGSQSPSGIRKVPGCAWKREGAEGGEGSLRAPASSLSRD